MELYQPPKSAGGETIKCRQRASPDALCPPRAICAEGAPPIMRGCPNWCEDTWHDGYGGRTRHPCPALIP